MGNQTELTDNERQQLAREVAAQRYVSEGGSMDPSDCWDAGWDAAMEHTADAREVCRLLSMLDWVVGYELVQENQLILDKAQELALKVMGMSDPSVQTQK